MLSEREEHILDGLEYELVRTGRHRLRASILLFSVVVVFGGQLLATPFGIVVALIGFLGTVLSSGGYIADSRSRRHRRVARPRGIRILSFRRRW